MGEYQERIIRYVSRAFESIPPSQQAEEAKEELCANLIAKFEGLTAAGRSNEDAYYETIGSIGDIYEMMDDLREGTAGPAVQESGVNGAFQAAAVYLSYFVGLAVALLAFLLFYHAAWAPLWKAAAAVITAVFLIGYLWSNRMKQAAMRKSPLVVAAVFLALLLITLLMPLRINFERVAWLWALMALSAYEIIAAAIPMIRHGKEKKDNE